MPISKKHTKQRNAQRGSRSYACLVCIPSTAALPRADRSHPMASGRARHRSPPPCSRCGCRGSGSLAGTLARCSDRRTAGLSTHAQSMESEAPRARGSSKRLAHCRPSPIVSCRFACTIGRRLPGPLCPGAPPSRTLGTCSCISAGCGPARAPSAHPQSAVPPWQRQASQAVPSQRGSGDPARRPRTAGSCQGRPATRGGPSCPQRRSDNPKTPQISWLSRLLFATMQPMQLKIASGTASLLLTACRLQRQGPQGTGRDRASLCSSCAQSRPRSPGRPFGPIILAVPASRLRRKASVRKSR